MREDLLTDLGLRILQDLARNSLAEALPAQLDRKLIQGRLPRSPIAPTGEDMDTRLRGIRRYITAKELAGLMHWHPETVYRKAREGMPVDRDVGPDGRGRRLKIYPPKIADWLRECREVRTRLIESKQLSDGIPVDCAPDKQEQKVEVKK